MKLSYHPFELPLRHPFGISRGVTTVQPTLVVELSEAGHRGYGEATANAYYGATVQSMTRSLDRVRQALEARKLVDPEQLWSELAGVLADDPFAQCALDQAAHDLWGKIRGRRVYELWGLKAERLPPTSFTIGIDSIETMVAKLQEMPDWPIYKIKLGTDQDLDILRQLRRHTKATFRVDANCGWGVQEAIDKSRQLRELNVEFIEQPLPADDQQGMREVYARSALPIVADESCAVEGDIERCAGSFHGVNIKLVKCGGLAPARRMLRQARQLGLKTMVGCMTESSVGISAAAQLLPMLDYADLDGALLLDRDVAKGVTIERGRLRYADEHGCGVSLVA